MVDATDPQDAPGAPERQPGWREVALVAATIVVVVLVVATITLIVPDLREAVGRLPLLIVVLIGGTALVVWRILRAPSARR